MCSLVGTPGNIYFGFDCVLRVLFGIALVGMQFAVVLSLLLRASTCCVLEDRSFEAPVQNMCTQH